MFWTLDLENSLIVAKTYVIFPDNENSNPFALFSTMELVIFY